MGAKYFIESIVSILDPFCALDTVVNVNGDGDTGFLFESNNLPAKVKNAAPLLFHHQLSYS